MRDGYMRKTSEVNNPGLHRPATGFDSTDNIHGELTGSWFRSHFQSYSACTTLTWAVVHSSTKPEMREIEPHIWPFVPFSIHAFNYWSHTFELTPNRFLSELLTDGPAIRLCWICGQVSGLKHSATIDHYTSNWFTWKSNTFIQVFK